MVKFKNGIYYIEKGTPIEKCVENENCFSEENKAKIYEEFEIYNFPNWLGDSYNALDIWLMDSKQKQKVKNDWSKQCEEWLSDGWEKVKIINDKIVYFAD